MISKKKYLSDLIVFAIFLLILVLLKFSTFNTPYLWDDLDTVIPPAIWGAGNSLIPVYYDLNIMHPPFLYSLLSLFYLIFGVSPYVGHMLVFSFGWIALIFTYLIGKQLFSRAVAVVATLLLLFSPLFIAQISIVNSEIILTALFVMSLHLYLKNKTWFYVIAASLLVLTKERQLLLPFLIVIYDLFVKRNRSLKRLLTLFIPIFVSLGWIISNKLIYGIFFYPTNTGAILFSPLEIILKIGFILKYLLFDDYRITLTLIILLAPLIGFSHYKSKKIVLGLFFGLLSWVVFFNFSYILNSLLSSNLIERYVNIQSYISTIENFSIPLALLIFLFVISVFRFRVYWKKEESYLLFSILILFTLVFSSFLFWLPRYSTFFLPLIFLIGARSIITLFKKFSFIPVIFLIGLFVFTWTGDRDVPGFYLDNNLEFLDYIGVRQDTADYLDEFYNGKTIVANYPELFDLQYPWAGYLDDPSFKIQGLIKVKPNSLGPDLITGYKDRLTSVVNSDGSYEILYLNQLTEEEILSADLVYYSPQSYKRAISKNTINSLLESSKLKLIKKFESNNKYVYLYEVNKF